MGNPKVRESGKLRFRDNTSKKRAPAKVTNLAVVHLKALGGSIEVQEDLAKIIDDTEY